MKTNPSFLDYLKIHFIVILFAFTAILGNATTANSLTIVFFRCLITSIGLYFLIQNFRNNKIRKPIKRVWIINGIFISIHWLLFFGAAKVSTIAMCLAGLSTQTFWTSLMEPIYFKKSIDPFEVIMGIIVIIALSIIYFSDLSAWIGLVMGISSGFFGALFSVINGKFKNYDPKLITFYEMGTATIITGFFWLGGLIFSGKAFIPMGLDWLWISILALICTVYAFTEIIKLYKVFTVFSVNLIITLEPVYGIILGYLIFREKEIMPTSFYWGTALLLSTVIAHPILKRYQKRKLTKLQNL